VSTAGSGDLALFATRVDHTVGILRSLASAHEASVQTLAPGLLAVETDRVDALIAAASEALTPVETDEVHCLVLDHADLSDAAVIGRAMTSPSLAEAGARVQNADLVALFENEAQCFHSAYQRIVTLADSRVIGYEALRRAETLSGQPVMPDVLFPAAEAAGWIHLLDRVGRTTALREAGPWLGEALLFINFIPTSIYRPEVCLRTTEAAAVQAGIRLDQLVFEVTEGHKIEEIGHLERVFEHYRGRRCKVALDDLGSGYSSLNLLVRLQPDIVKLDKEIVQALPGPTSTEVVGAVVKIVHSYGGLVLAECVETEEQAEAAADLHVDLAQGWFFGRPERHLPMGTPASHPVRPAPEPSVPAQPHLPDPAVAVAPDPAEAGAGDDTEPDTRPMARMVERSTAPTV
jgi:EAL domain-containing protein (putative c-di-GMP-specific phosphodiesterase class I)